MIISAKKLAGYVLFIAGLVILFSLGWWQLNRGLEKADIAEKSSLGEGRGLAWIEREQDWPALSYSLAGLRGQWQTTKTLLLENRLYQGQPGFEVLVPFQLSADGQSILVNRGWIHQQSIAPGEQHADLADIAIEVMPRGQLYLPETGFTLGQSIVSGQTGLRRFLYYDFEALSALIGAQLAPAVLVLEEAHPASFRRIWEPGSIAPERHYAYTAQWWGLFLTLLVFGFVWRRRS